ncbi:hypothetical protein KKG81_00245 [bacterium]|nr:hypothetical protein [bacterium]
MQIKKIVLISCVSKKLHHKSKAEDLYISSLFKKGLEYAKLLQPDKIFILSAKYGLVNLKQEIEPYNITLNNMVKEERVIWSKNILSKLKKLTDIENDEFVFLAGKKYIEFLLPKIKHFKIPLKDALQSEPKNRRGIGCQMKWLDNQIKLL